MGKNNKNPVVGVIMGSKSDWEIMKNCCDTLKLLKIKFDARVISAHRTPKRLEKFINHGNGISLLFNRSDTKWFHQWAIKSDAILFKKGRIKFLLNGEGKGSSQAPSIFLAMGEECCNAIKKFEGLYVDLREKNDNTL